MINQPTVFVIEPDHVVRDTVSSIARGLELRCEPYTNGQDFLASFDPHRPGCLVLEVRIPGVNGLVIQETLGRTSAVLPMIFLSSSPSVSIAIHVMRAGALHFLEKPLHEHQLWTAIDEAIDVDHKRRQARSQRDEIEACLKLLTDSELAVLELTASDKNKRAMAGEMDISVRTLEHYRTRLMRKLKLHSSTALMCFAVKAMHYGLLRQQPIQPRGNGGNGYIRHVEGSPSMIRPHNGRTLKTGLSRGGLP